MARLIVGSVVIPFLFVLVMSGVEYLARPRLLWDLMTDVGWDMCILGIGVTGGIVSAPEMEKGWGPEVLAARGRDRHRRQPCRRHQHPDLEERPRDG
jgi:hypothetical protein